MDPWIDYKIGGEKRRKLGGCSDPILACISMQALKRNAPKPELKKTQTEGGCCLWQQ
jgi:hypothetical protein